MMKKFTIALLSTIFVALVACSIQSIYADHELDNGIFKDQDHVKQAYTRDSNSKYQIYLHVEIRNTQGQLISIAETSYGSYIPHEISDLLFYEKSGVKPEIITIDDIKYEKVQGVDVNPPKKDAMVDYFSIWSLKLCGEMVGHEPSCMPVFQASNTVGLVSQTDVVINHWTILRVIN